MNTFGEINWTDDFVGGSGKKGSGGKDLFLRLNEGSNIVRLVTQPYQYLVHKYKKDPENPKDFGQKVNCSAVNGSCPLCEAGDKAKARWLLGVISRPSNTYKILDVSWTVFAAIRKLAKNSQHFGDPTKYDIIIEVDKQGGSTGYYSIQPLSKEPLSAADQVIKDSVDLDDLKRRVSPPTAEQVLKKMEKIREGTTTEATPVTTSTTTSTAKKIVKATPVSMSDDDDDLEKSFPSYDGDSA